MVQYEEVVAPGPGSETTRPQALIRMKDPAEGISQKRRVVSDEESKVDARKKPKCAPLPRDGDSSQVDTVNGHGDRDDHDGRDGGTGDDDESISSQSSKLSWHVSQTNSTLREYTVDPAVLRVQEWIIDYAYQCGDNALIKATGHWLTKKSEATPWLDAHRLAFTLKWKIEEIKRECEQASSCATNGLEKQVDEMVHLWDVLIQDVTARNLGNINDILICARELRLTRLCLAFDRIANRAESVGIISDMTAAINKNFSKQGAVFSDELVARSESREDFENHANECIMLRNHMMERLQKVWLTPQSEWRSRLTMLKNLCGTMFRLMERYRSQTPNSFIMELALNGSASRLLRESSRSD